MQNLKYLALFVIIILFGYFGWNYLYNPIPEEYAEEVPFKEEGEGEKSQTENTATVLKAILRGVESFEDRAAGTATIVRTDKLAHEVHATLPRPTGNKVYEGWLVNPDTSEFFSTGVMEGGNKGVYTLSYESSENLYESYNYVVITEEVSVTDNKPEIHVLEGLAE